ncbi:hypothetical protein CHGG_07644 [Chaetomium globosum CBS 148.51]|uniref:FAD-binding domain-containing protein n=1 Tax=Chaetomium globosum (strain ATCC 6205 / CBS 148.51 / DSM 1962 / NBRC 6347 / NRRL 1970) TaxID=306901 RepID=Q2GWL0_CHAGB|nr:uncharacterized protein CHGG_07644 [Chaetomium globosum CBS 148.51]EAQ86391.1 hypothetical protein CHGG_07644 [Chaetomium globosum CBS 148.51]
MGDVVNEPRNALGNEDGALRPPLDVAIVGGGLVGVIAALGLVHRGIRVTVYERGAKFQELGAGIGFPRVARECMQRMDPRVLDALARVTQQNPHDTVRYWDGFNPRTKESSELKEGALLFDVPERDLAFWSCLRSHFLLEMVALLPEGVTQFGKRLVEYIDEEKSDKVVLRFADGSRAEADVVIGCDGIHSTTRKLLLGADHPASHPTYSHKKIFRGLAPINAVANALGVDKAHDYIMHLGPNAHTLSFPVNNGTLGYMLFAIHDADEWADPHTMTAPSTRDQVARAFQSWGPHIVEAVSLLPEKLDMYGVFDMADHPAPIYAAGRVCIAGDAAHASSPFHGVGAGMGIEDALVLVELLAQVRDQNEAGAGAGPPALTAALKTFSTVRMERTHWLVQSSRDMGNIYQWRYPDTGRDSAKIKAEFERRARKIWDFDVDGMVADAKKEYGKRRAGEL